MKGTRTTTPPSPEIKCRPSAPERKRRTITGKEQHRAKRLRSDNRELKTEGFEEVVPSVSEWEPWWLYRFWDAKHVHDAMHREEERLLALSEQFNFNPDEFTKLLKTTAT